MMRSLVLPVLACLATAVSCVKSPPIGGSRCSSQGPVVVYKTKKDYSKNISVRLSDDKKSILAYPGRRDGLKPIMLADGYYLKNMVGNTFLSIDIDEYADTNNHYPFDQLMNYIIDDDPFISSYECCDYASRDTAELNRIIRNNELDKCRKF